MRIGTGIVAAFGILFGSMTAVAAPVRWYLSGVTFSDGGTAVGSFIYDADTAQSSQIAIETTGSIAFSYTRHVASLPYALDVDTGVKEGGKGFLQLVTVTDMTNAGGTLAVGRHPVDYVMYSTEQVYQQYDFGIFHGPVIREVVSETESANAGACAAVDQAIEALNARMRQAYSSSEGEYLRDRWHALKERRYSLKCGR